MFWFFSVPLPKDVMYTYFSEHFVAKCTVNMSVSHTFYSVLIAFIM